MLKIVMHFSEIMFAKPLAVDIHSSLDTKRDTEVTVIGLAWPHTSATN